MATLLTYARISKLMTPGRYFDGGSGLHLLVKQTGKKYWVFRYSHSGKRQDMGLGVFPRVPLADARKASHAARALLDNGVSPLQKKTTDIAVQAAVVAKRVAFREFALDCVEAKRPEWRNQKHGDQWVFTLTEYAFPVIGGKPLDQIDTDDILAILKPIWTTKTETASRLRGRIERILSAATTKKLRTGVNPALWRGHLDTLLAQPRKVARVKHHTAMPFAELPVFIADLQGRDAVTALALEFCILTTARTSEVTGARRNEVADNLWTVPAERMKAGRTHRVPLVPRALELLKKAKAQDPSSDYLFSGNRRPLSNMAMLTLLDRMKCNVTVHGFRSSFRDWVSEATRHSPELAEMALAHSIGNKVEAAYRRGDLLDGRRKLMLDWEAYCMSGLGNVIELRAA
ncbi:MAG: Prophage integrase IntA [Nitrosomonadaceae bacterium]|nr:Prophage integrase IntA [Nitrosomonadaceae bacterium]